MRHDHPYLTEQLMEMRAEQRRTLRCIPDWIAETARISRPGPRLPDPDGALVEIELRRLADQEMEPLRSWIHVWRLHTESEAIERWFREAEISAALDDVARQVRADYEAKRAAEYPQGLYSLILRVVTLLAWADELAGDYADPRLERFHAQWRAGPARVA